MEFNFNNLRNAYENGESLGEWKNLRVFACPKHKLLGFGNGAFYIVYDDNNAIVGQNRGQWYKFGNVSVEGRVTEHSKQIYMLPAYEVAKAAEEMPHAVCGKTAAACDGTVEVVADVNINLDIENMLKAARTMTVSSLLEGFNYGL